MSKETQGCLARLLMMTNLRFALRQLLKNPGFTAAAVLALALGIGVNTAIFSLTNALLLRPVPGVKEPGQIVQLGSSLRGEGFSTLAHGAFQSLRDQSSSFSGMCAHADLTLGLSGPNGAERIRGQIVSANFFDVLGVKMAAGRGFLPEEEHLSSAAASAVISHRFWEQHFASDPGIIGRTITLNAHPFTIVGVAAPKFTGILVTRANDVWVPMSMLAAALPDFNNPADVLASPVIQWHQAFARLKPGVTVHQARAELDALFKRVQATLANPAPEGISLVEGLGFTPSTGSDISVILGLLQAVVGVVLLIACANVANMQLARGATRVRELGIRLALGASRWRLGWQLLVENLVLSAFALLLGVLLSLWFARLLLAVSPHDISTTGIDPSPDWRVVSFAGAAALLAAVAAGVFPAWHAGRTGVLAALRESSTQTGSRGSRLRNSFVVAQIALSLLLLVGAGLFVRTFQAALQTHPGYAVHSVLIGSVDLRLLGYEEERGRRFFDELLARVSALPGVEAAGLAPWSPFSGASFGAPVQSSGGKGGAEVQSQTTFSIVTPDFFKALDIPILKGRAFNSTDLKGSTPVAILDESTARALFHDGEAVGRQIRIGSMTGFRPLQVVGVVRDVRFRNLLRAPEKTVYLSFSQDYLPWSTLHLRSAQPPAALIKPVLDVVKNLDSSVALSDLQPLSLQLDRSLWQQRFSATLMTAFGLLALGLAALGIYGVISYSVTQRTRELGVRMALGARPRDVMLLILRQAATLMLVGGAVGLAASLALGRLVASQLYGVTASDPLTLLAVTVLLASVAIVSAYLPARRATKVDPMIALRAE